MAKAVAKAFGKASDDLARASAKWWSKAGSKAAEETAEGAARMAEKLVTDFKQVSELGEKAGAEVNKLIRSGHGDLSKALQRLRSEILDDQREIQRLTRTVYPTKKIDPQQIDEVAHEQAEQMLMDLQGRVAENQELMQTLSGAWQRANSGDVKGALEILRASDAPMTHPGVAQARGKYEEAFNLTKNIMNQSTPGSDAAFVKKYIALKRSPAAQRKLELWLANPQNNARLNRLMSKDKIADLISGGGKLTRRQKLLGLTMGDTAKRLGISTAALAGGAGLLKIYNWFNENPPAERSRASNNLSSSLARLEVYGRGRVPLNEAKSSLSDIAKLSTGVNSALKGPNAERAAQMYVTKMSKEINDINSALEDWDAVIEGSNNPGMARQFGQKISGFVQEHTNNLMGLAKQLGVEADVSKTPGMPSKSPGKNEVSEIQGLLGINQTGRVDRNTIRALKGLEQDFNRKADTNKWTSALVAPDGRITDLNTLIKAFNIINKY